MWTWVLDVFRYREVAISCNSLIEEKLTRGSRKAQMDKWFSKKKVSRLLPVHKYHTTQASQLPLAIRIPTYPETTAIRTFIVKAEMNTSVVSVIDVWEE